MKVLLTIAFMSFAFLGFSQERKQLETPKRLTHCKIELPAISLPEIVNPNKPVVFIDGIRLICHIQIPLEALHQSELITNGLPSYVGGEFFCASKEQEAGWNETTLWHWEQ